MVNSNPDNPPERKTVQLMFVLDQFFKQSKLGPIWGTVYFQIGGREAFPDRGWTDLVGAFLRCWLDALISVADGTTRNEEAPFFDGPLWCIYPPPDKNAVQLTFVHNGVVKHTAITSIEELLRNAVAVAEEFLAVCGQRGWSNGDTETLAVLSGQAARTLTERSSLN
jgi:hypothetical protein